MASLDSRPEAGDAAAAVYRDALEHALERVIPVLGGGRLPEHIPALAGVPRDAFGFAFATAEEVHGVGDWMQPFSIQSIVKMFALALVLARDGASTWTRVGRRPSGDAFNSLAQLEHDGGVPRNPWVNAGALVVVDRLQELTGDACETVCAFLREEAGDPAIGTDPAVAASESEGAHRNAALAHLLASYGRLRNPVETVLDHYLRLCAVRMSCQDLALASSFLARQGVRRDGTRLLGRSDAKRVNAVLLMGGVYEKAGEFAYRVGLPCKSGVGGGIVAVIPGRCTLCAWSPGLDASGNSVAGTEALDAFTTATGWSIF